MREGEGMRKETSQERKGGRGRKRDIICVVFFLYILKEMRLNYQVISADSQTVASPQAKLLPCLGHGYR